MRGRATEGWPAGRDERERTSQITKIYTTKRRGRRADPGGWAAARETAKAARRVRRLREARINSNRRLARRVNRDFGTSRERVPQGSSEGGAGWENLRIK